MRAADVAAEKAALAEKLEQVHRELRAEADDFPAHLLTVRPAPEEWSAMELLGHVAEMHYSYVARAERLMASPGTPLARPMDSPERLEGIGRGLSGSLDDALAQLDAARLHALAFLERLTPEEMAIQGHHASLGQLTVRDVFDRTIVGHARNHLDQLRRTREQVLTRS